VERKVEDDNMGSGAGTVVVASSTKLPLKLLRAGLLVTGNCNNRANFGILGATATNSTMSSWKDADDNDNTDDKLDELELVPTLRMTSANMHKSSSSTSSVNLL
jgi:hypothetical protein